MSRRTVFLTAAVAAAFALGSLSADAQSPPAATPDQTAAPAAKKKGKKMTPRQEAEQSAQSGTVPKRYMKNVPKEYHHLIPFSK